MADVVFTTAITPGPGADVEYTNPAGETMTPMTACYLDTTTTPSKLKKCNTTTAVLSNFYGYTLASVILDQPCPVIKRGKVNTNSVLAPGQIYGISGTGHAGGVAGGTCPVADYLAAEFPCVTGMAVTTSQLEVGKVYAGVAKP